MLWPSYPFFLDVLKDAIDFLGGSAWFRVIDSLVEFIDVLSIPSSLHVHNHDGFFNDATAYLCVRKVSGIFEGSAAWRQAYK